MSKLHPETLFRRRELMQKPLPSYQVLVVDDSAVSRKLVEHALEPSGHTLLFAKSGAEALELFRRHAPSIIVTDWMMPDFSGLELCQKIRAEDQREYTYIVVLSAKSEKDNVVKGLAAGADDYLTKPFDAGELLARIGVGCRTVELHREIDAKNRLLEALARTDSMTDLPRRRAPRISLLGGASRSRFLQGNQRQPRSRCRRRRAQTILRGAEGQHARFG